VFKKPADKIRMRTRQDNFHAVARLAHFQDHRLDALADVVRFTRYLFAAWQDGLRLSQRDGGCAALKALHSAVHQIALHGRVFVEDRLALGLANLLDHHLFGALRGNAAQLGRIDADFAFLGSNLARLAVNGDGDFRLETILLLRGQLQGRLNAFENYILGNVLFPVHQVHNPQYIGAIHGRSSLVTSSLVIDHKTKKVGTSPTLGPLPDVTPPGSAPCSASRRAGPDSKPIPISDQTSGRVPYGDKPLLFADSQFPCVRSIVPTAAGRRAQKSPAAPAQAIRSGQPAWPGPAHRLAPA